MEQWLQYLSLQFFFISIYVKHGKNSLFVIYDKNSVTGRLVFLKNHSVAWGASRNILNVV